MKRAEGFTLLETLVALIVVAVALAAVTRALGMGVNTVETVDQIRFGQAVAQNRMAYHRAFSQWPEAGSRGEGVDVMAGRVYYWAEDAFATPNADFRRLEVKVYGDSGRTWKVASLTGYLLNDNGARERVAPDQPQP